MRQTAYFRNHEVSYYYSIPYDCKKMTVIKQREGVSIIDRFNAETPDGKSLWMKQNVLSIIRFVSLVQLPKIKIFCMVPSEHTEVVEGSQTWVAPEFLDSEQAADNSSIHDDGAASDEEDESDL